MCLYEGVWVGKYLWNEKYLIQPNYEKAHANLPFCIHVGGLVKGIIYLNSCGTIS